MTLDTRKFAALISYISCRTNAILDDNDIEVIMNRIIELMPKPQEQSQVYVSEEAVNALLAAMGKHGKKIEAIKAYRTLTHAGLKEAKDAVEKYWIDDPKSQPASWFNR